MLSADKQATYYPCLQRCESFSFDLISSLFLLRCFVVQVIKNMSKVLGKKFLEDAHFVPLHQIIKLVHNNVKTCRPFSAAAIVSRVCLRRKIQKLYLFEIITLTHFSQLHVKVFCGYTSN